MIHLKHKNANTVCEDNHALIEMMDDPSL
jgi:hypothetical protein